MAPYSERSQVNKPTDVLRARADLKSPDVVSALVGNVLGVHVSISSQGGRKEQGDSLSPNTSTVKLLDPGVTEYSRCVRTSWGDSPLSPRPSMPLISLGPPIQSPGGYWRMGGCAGGGCESTIPCVGRQCPLMKSEVIRAPGFLPV